MSKRIAVLVSGGGTNLQALIDAQGRGELVNGRISAVISSTPDAFALERAKNAGIPGYVLPRRDFSDSRGYTAALTRLLRETVGADLVVMAGFMTILTEELFQAYPNAVINIHPSLIPSFCGVGCYGLHVHEKALEYGVKIILQKAAEVLPGDTPEVLQRRIMEQCEWKLLPQAVSLFCQDRLKVEGRAVRILDCL